MPKPRKPQRQKPRKVVAKSKTQTKTFDVVGMNHRCKVRFQRVSGKKCTRTWPIHASL